MNQEKIAKKRRIEYLENKIERLRKIKSKIEDYNERQIVIADIYDLAIIVLELKLSISS